jgi:hypothetical protein
MPTGYTADVQSGKITELPDFAMQCARAFGALISLRDEPSNAPIPDEFKPSSYNATKLEEAHAELVNLQAMTNEERRHAASETHKKAIASWDKYEAEKVAQRERYAAMLEKVDAWEPPGPDHFEMKKFMRDQLSESTRFDCGESYSSRPEPQTADVWFSDAVAKATKDIAYHTKEHAMEVERANTRTKWVSDLRKSLETAT